MKKKTIYKNFTLNNTLLSHSMSIVFKESLLKYKPHHQRMEEKIVNVELNICFKYTKRIVKKSARKTYIRQDKQFNKKAKSN